MRYLLFTTTTCPKCPAMKEFVSENISFEGELIDNNAPGFMKKAGELRVDSAPTIIIFDDSGAEVFRGSEPQEAKEFLEK